MMTLKVSIARCPLWMKDAILFYWETIKRSWVAQLSH